MAQGERYAKVLDVAVAAGPAAWWPATLVSNDPDRQLGLLRRRAGPLGVLVPDGPDATGFRFAVVRNPGYDPEAEPEFLYVSSFVALGPSDGGDVGTGERRRVDRRRWIQCPRPRH